jgi:uncharacterized membrane protein YjjP (DUF1212 family)
MSTQPEQDWGGSEGAKAAELRETNRQKRFERWMQVVILGIFCIFIFALRLSDWLTGTSTINDVLLIAVPLFSFALGKADPGNG